MKTELRPQVFKQTSKYLKDRRSFLQKVVSQLGNNAVTMTHIAAYKDHIRKIDRAEAKIRAIEEGKIFPLEIGSACELAWDIFEPCLSTENEHSMTVVRTDNQTKVVVGESYLRMLFEMMCLGREAIAWGGKLNIVALIHYKQTFITMRTLSTERPPFEMEGGRQNRHLKKFLAQGGVFRGKIGRYFLKTTKVGFETSLKLLSPK